MNIIFFIHTLIHLEQPSRNQKRRRNFLTRISRIFTNKKNADFVVYDKIILEVKTAECISKGHLKQRLNYLAASKMK